ncbi:hypothetical protein MBLNU459_g1005t1 [Dothideomycetes sp. NU459]
MNGTNGYPAQSRTASDTSTFSDPRRGPPPPPPPQQQQQQPQQHSSSASMNRAERFEVEKRRMIESCFSKLDADGQLSESYITHVRVQEDAAHPSNPPPPTSPPDNKKPRVVIIAVRSTGRVRMHKARENSNGSFSIGKTWNLEDLSAIESYAHAGPATGQREHYREWAGAIGFTVTISKPYYWQAGTAKEKDFFIASLVKIFRKYTKGQVPELRGYQDAEVEAMLGIMPGQQPPPRPQPGSNRGSPVPPRLPFVEQNRSASQDRPDSRQRGAPRDAPRHPPDLVDPAAPRAPSATRRQMSQEPAARQRMGSEPSQQYEPAPPPRDQTRQPRPMRSMEQGLRQVASRERLKQPSQEQLRAPSRDRARPGPSQFAPPRPAPPPSHLTPQSSVSDMRAPRSESPAASASSRLAVQGQAPQPPSLQTADRQRSYQSVQSSQSTQSPRSNETAADGAALFNSTVGRWKPQEVPQEDPTPQRLRPRQEDPQPQPQPQPKPVELREPAGHPDSGRNFSYEVQAPPERKRPLMTNRDWSESSDAPDLRPPPLATSRNVSAAGGRPQSPAVEQPQEQDRMPGTFYETPAASTSNLNTPQPQQQQEDPMSSVEPEASAQAAAVPAAYSPSPIATPEVQTPEAEEDDEGMHRPGLGPMIKKKNKGDIANTFRKAATAYNAFKPRAGGAGERLAKGADANGPDGINAVVPAPMRKMSTDADKVEAPADPVQAADIAAQVPENIPEVEVTSPMASPVAPGKSGNRQMHTPLTEEVASQPAAAEPESQLAPPSEPRRQKRRSPQQENYLRALNIDPRLLEGRGLEFETILTDFGWGSNVLKSRQLDDLEADLRRELGRVEAGSWLGHLEQKDDRVEVVDQMLDRAIAECDELEGLLTLYAVELGSLNDDIAFIEAQSQGLQVQTANQKILHAELQKLVDTISITPNQLQPLRYADLSNPDSLMEIESSLLVLYKAMVTIDPSVRSSNAISTTKGNHSTSGIEGSEIGNMNALQEKRQEYQYESAAFCKRLAQHLETLFAASLGTAHLALTQSSVGINANSMKLNSPAYNLARANLFQFSPLLLFTKEIQRGTWSTLLRSYYHKARPLYTKVFHENTQAWKKAVRSNTGDSAELLFTSVEKEPSEGLTSTARKLTVKRSQTLAKTFRAASGDKPSSSDLRQVGRLLPCEVFAGILDEQAPLLSMEQNFFVDLFHATTLENVDFADAVAAAVPDARLGPDLTARRLMEPNREIARQVFDTMDEMFQFWPTEMKTTLEWAVASDPIQGVGILTSLAVHASNLQETSQEFLLNNLNSLSSRLTTLFQKFVDEQIRAIEDTKVKIKKRKGVIAFMKIFPPFSAAVENVYSGAAGRAEGTAAVSVPRHLIDDAYTRINKAMFDSLKVIARESPTALAASAAQGADPEDKEILNYHILLIENMHHYIEDVDDGGKDGSVLAEWRGRALMERAEHLEEYVGRVVRRPLGKVLDFVESSETLLAQKLPGSSIAARPSHSRSSTKKLLAAHDSKETRRGIDTLRKRIEKHFGEADEEQLSRQLVGLVCKECERRYDQILERLQRVCRELYKDEEKGVDIDWTEADIRAGFKRY